MQWGRVPRNRLENPLPKTFFGTLQERDRQAGAEALEAFRQLLLHRGGNFARAWRCLLDPGRAGSLTLPQLAKCCRELGYRESVLAQSLMYRNDYFGPAVP